MRVSAHLLICAFAWPALISAQAADPTQKTYILLNARSATDDDLAKIYTAAAQAYNLADWEPFPTAGNTSLPQIVASRYNILPGDELKYPQTTQAIVSTIAKVNSWTGPTLPPVLLVPRLPSIPNRTARPDLVQVQDLTNGYKVRTLDSLSLHEGEHGKQHWPLSEAGTIAFLNTPQLQTRLSDQRGSRFIDRLYPQVDPRSSFPIFPLSDEVACESRVAHTTPLHIKISDELKARLAQIDPSEAGYLYVLDLDVDSPKCTHGRKVGDIAKQLLAEYGAPQLVDHVKTIELNYFAHPTEARRNVSSILTNIIDNDLRCNYLHLFAQSFDRPLTSCDDSINDIAIPTSAGAQELTVPGYYLWLIYQFLLDPSSHASVVSNSYYTYTNGFDIAGSVQPFEWPALVAAVLNPDPDNLAPSYVDEIKKEQPAKQFFQIDEKNGTFLVGAVTRNGESFGMTSSRKSTKADYGALTSFALGEGYGTVDNASHVTSSISPDEKGTSFATPAISVELFLARALCKSEIKRAQANFSAPLEEIGILEAKRRLKLSAIVDPNLIGKAASAGVPNLERLATFGTGTADVLVKKDVGSIEITTIATASVSYDGLKRSYPIDFSGVQCPNGNLYVFDEKIRAWRQADPHSLYVEISNRAPLNTEQFFALYQSLARYSK